MGDLLVRENLVETLIDGRPIRWPVGGDFAWGQGPALSRAETDPRALALDPEGYFVLDLPGGVVRQVRHAAAAFLRLPPDALQAYHRHADDASHAQLIERSRELRFADLGLDAGAIIALLEPVLGLRLSPIVPMVGSDHVQLRINRPGSTDYNPPHRDGALPVWANSVNIWLPVAGVDERTSLCILPGSHRLAEENCWQTLPGGATIDGKKYRVPAIARLRDGPLRMIRAPVRGGQALIFSPYLIHGLALNETTDVTRMALEFRFEIV
jgi:Phytanoyl-CoA dioxygenase (PhyH)